MEPLRRLGELRLRSLVLLGALLMVIVTTPLQEQGTLAEMAIHILQMVVFCLGGYLLTTNPRWLRTYLIVLVPTLLIGVVTTGTVPGAMLVTIYTGLVVTLQMLLYVAVVRFSLFNDEAGMLDRLLAGICGYLLLGLLWASGYTLLEFLAPGSLTYSGGEALSLKDGSMLYYSLITLSTLGYGDILPITPTARMLAGLESVAGTLYLAVYIASLLAIQKRPKGKKNKSSATK